MNTTAAKSMLALMPTAALLCGSLIVFYRHKTAYALLQLLGVGFLVIVVLAHILEGFRLLTWMGWGQQQSIGHYIDLCSAIMAAVLFPAGYFLQSLRPK